jgi:hypothetical protein
MKKKEKEKKKEEVKKREGLIASLFWLKLLAHKTRGSAAAAAVGKGKKKTQSTTHTYIYRSVAGLSPHVPFKSGRPVASGERQHSPSTQHIHSIERQLREHSTHTGFSQWFLIPRRVSFRQENHAL